MKYEIIEGDIAKLTLENGKANAITMEIAQQFMDFLERAKTESKGILLCGHAGMFSAGFDLKVMTAGLDSAAAMINQGTLLLEKMYSHPQPIVVACEGHAIGMGIFLLLAADYRIGASGAFSFRLPETAIDIPFNPALRILAKTHIDPLHHSRAIIQSEVYKPEEAAKIGIVDEVCEPDQVMERAIAKLKELYELPAASYEVNKHYIREEVIEIIYNSLHEID